jgi:hypothetical protein
VTQLDLAQRLTREARDILIGELIFGALVLVGVVVVLVPLAVHMLQAPMHLVEASFGVVSDLQRHP